MTCLASTGLFCHTFPWTAESSQWFPGQQPVFSQLLCSYRCSHSERTLLLVPHPLSRQWPEPIWVPQVLSAGHQLRQKTKQKISRHLTSTARQPMTSCVLVSLLLYLSRFHSRVWARRARADRLSGVSFWAAPEHEDDPVKLGRDPASLTGQHSALPMNNQRHKLVWLVFGVWLGDET